MAGNLLSNSTFASHSPADTLPHDPTGFCEGWLVRSQRNGAFELKPAPDCGEQGFRLETDEVLPSSSRIWQRIDAARFEGAQSARLDISARGDGAPGGITLEWVALLKVEQNGSRVFARKLLNKAYNFGDIEGEFSTDVILGDLEPGVDYDFALQFAGGPGFIEVHSVELIAGVFAPAATNDNLPSPPPVAAEASRLGCANGQARAFADRLGKASAIAPAPIPPPRRPDRAGAKQHVAVVAWDMGHNPAGRAFLLADMAARNCTTELVGPLFPQYGDEIWKPISASPLPMHAYPAPTFRTFVEGAIAIAQRTTCDIVHVGKARFPSLLLGALIKQANNCPMIVDIDDHELGFFASRAPATLHDLMAEVHADPTILDRPYTEIFTRYAESLIAECDGVTVSNYALKDRFGGIVVRHGRDERIFDPQRYDRSAIRRDFGYGDQDRVILFLGTPRAHKGVFEIADAMEALADDRLALCIIGSINDKRVSGRLGTYKRARIASHPDQPWERLAELVAMADAVFLLQDPASAISDYQISAKLTDALAMGVPVFATPVPPLRDLIAVGAVMPVADTAQLRAALQSVSEKPSTVGADQRARDYYLTELSYGVNAARLDIAFDAATTQSRKAVPAFDDLFAAMELQTGIVFPRFTRKFGAPAIWKNVRPDLVFLWKQNDSGIYGRRSDMMVRYLLESGAVNRVLHFDAPISATDLERHNKHGEDAVADQGNLVHLSTTRRVLRIADTGQYARRTFSIDPTARPSTISASICRQRMDMRISSGKI